jgi:hypothetical protein
MTKEMQDMQAGSRFLAFAAIVATVALVACGGGDVSPATPTATTALTSDSGSFTSSGNGPGAPSNPPAPGTGTCTSDCNGTGQGPGPGAGHGPGPASGAGGGNGYGPGPGPSDGYCGNACTGPVGPDPADIAAILGEAVQEEYRAQYLYESVLRTFGPDTAPFALIAQAEARHVEALKQLLERREMAVPAWKPESFPTFATVEAACAAGVAAEAADAAFYDKYLPRTDLPQDARNVFTNLQAASLQNHLPAFELCR